MGNDPFVDFPREWALLALGCMQPLRRLLFPSGYRIRNTSSRSAWVEPSLSTPAIDVSWLWEWYAVALANKSDFGDFSSFLLTDMGGNIYLGWLILGVHLNRQNKDWLADTRKQKRATITKGEFSWWESHWVSIHHKIRMNGFPIHVPSSPPPSPFGTERPIIFHIASRRLHHLPSFALKLRAKKSVLFANIPFWYYVQGHPTWFYTGNGIIL